MTRIRITHPDVVHDVGDEVDVDDAKADRLVAIGYAEHTDGRDDPALTTTDTDDQPAQTEPEAPNKSANKAEWVEYAVANGADEADAEALTKAELVDRYGGGGG